MESIQIHSTEVSLTDEESKKLLAARNVIGDLVGCFLETCRMADKIGQEDNYISFGTLCETGETLDWLCDFAESGTPMKSCNKYTD